MGLCTSKSAVSLAPSARALSADAGNRVSDGSPTASPTTWDDRIIMIQATKTKVEVGGRGRAPNPTTKGYLELGGKVEGEPQTSREAEEEEEETEGDELEELLNFSDSEGSLRSEFLES